MNCNEVKDQLSLYMDGALTTDEMERIYAHLSVCPNCRSEFSFLSEMRELLSEIPQEYALSPDFDTRLRAALEEEKKQHAGFKQKEKIWKRYGSIAAVFFIVILSASIVLLGEQELLYSNKDSGYSKEASRSDDSSAEAYGNISLKMADGLENTATAKEREITGDVNQSADPPVDMYDAAAKNAAGQDTATRMAGNAVADQAPAGGGAEIADQENMIDEAESQMYALTSLADSIPEEDLWVTEYLNLLKEKNAEALSAWFEGKNQQAIAVLIQKYQDAFDWETVEFAGTGTDEDGWVRFQISGTKKGVGLIHEIGFKTGTNSTIVDDPWME